MNNRNELQRGVGREHAIEIRNLRFPLANTPKYWLAGQRAISMLLDHLSILFPPGEAFFMNSVRAFEERVEDPALRRAIRGFHAQEALHGREHTHYNERLAMLGYPVASIDRSTRSILWLATWILSKRAQLAVTVALEHFTALLAQVALGNDSFLRKADPEMAALWRWHAAEENEHAAVAFDVLKLVGGGYFLRTTIMMLVTVFFIGKVVRHQLQMMWSDRILFSLTEWRSLYRFFFRDPAVVKRVFVPYLRFYLPNFHPDQIDATKLMSDWKQEFESEPIYRTNLYKRAPKTPSAAPAAAV